MTPLSKQERRLCWEKLATSVGFYTPITQAEVDRILGEELGARLFATAAQERWEKLADMALEANSGPN